MDDLVKVTRAFALIARKANFRISSTCFYFHHLKPFLTLKPILITVNHRSLILPSLDYLCDKNFFLVQNSRTFSLTLFPYLLH